MSQHVPYHPDEVKKQKYQVQNAIEAARLVLDEKRVREMDLSSLKGADYKRKINLVELNDISEQIVIDSMRNVSWRSHPEPKR